MKYLNALQYNTPEQNGTGKPIDFRSWQIVMKEFSSYHGVPLDPFVDQLDYACPTEVTGFLGSDLEVPLNAFAMLTVRNGQLVVRPGDWILEIEKDVIVVVDQATKEKLDAKPTDDQ